MVWFWFNARNKEKDEKQIILVFGFLFFLIPPGFDYEIISVPTFHKQNF